MVSRVLRLLQHPIGKPSQQVQARLGATQTQALVKADWKPVATQVSYRAFTPSSTVSSSHASDHALREELRLTNADADYRMQFLANAVLVKGAERSFLVELSGGEPTFLSDLNKPMTPQQLWDLRVSLREHAFSAPEGLPLFDANARAIPSSDVDTGVGTVHEIYSALFPAEVPFDAQFALLEAQVANVRAKQRYGLTLTQSDQDLLVKHGAKVDGYRPQVSVVEPALFSKPASLARLMPGMPSGPASLTLGQAVQQVRARGLSPERRTQLTQLATNYGVSVEFTAQGLLKRDVGMTVKGPPLEVAEFVASVEAQLNQNPVARDALLDLREKVSPLLNDAVLSEQLAQVIDLALTADGWASKNNTASHDAYRVRQIVSTDLPYVMRLFVDAQPVAGKATAASVGVLRGQVQSVHELLTGIQQRKSRESQNEAQSFGSYLRQKYGKPDEASPDWLTQSSVVSDRT